MSEAANAFNSADHGFQMLDRGAIVPSLTNRKRFDPQLLSELAESIKAVGVAQPILVRPLPGSRLQETWTDRRAGDPAPTHEIVAGERRWRACGIAGVKTMPAMVRDLTDEQVLRLQLIENLQREDLHPLEEADGYRRILDLPDHASEPVAARIEELAGAIKKSTRYIYQTLQLLKLAEFPRQVFLDGKLQRTVALEVSTIGNEAQQIEACRRVAGLGPKGMEVVEHPMSYRAAAEYIRNNFRLLLSKAPFPVKVEFAGVSACTGCEKMSANARDLFEDGAKVPDTCLDPRCYGKKNAAHHEQIAEAAKAKGARVITGKEAKKLIPYEGSPTHLLHSSEYESLDEKRWDVPGKEAGKTVQQLLGDDIPLPVLIQRPDGQGFVKALPKKDVERLLKERGLVKDRTAQKNPQSEAERKARMVKEQRWAVAEALLQAVGNVPANEPSPLNLDDQNGLRAHLMLPMVGLMHYALDHECRKRLNKLLGVDEKTLPLHPDGELVDKYLQGLDGLGVNRFIVGCLIAGELYVGPYGSSRTERMDEIAALLKVDAKKITGEIAARQKQASKAKKGAAAKKSARDAQDDPARANPYRRRVLAKQAKQAPAGEETTAPGAVTTPAEAAPPPTFKVGDRVRFKEGLKGHAGMLRKVSGREGTVSLVRPSDGCVMVKTGTKGEGQGTRASASELELVSSRTDKEDDQLTNGSIELRDGTKLNPQPAWPFPTAAPKATQAPTAASGTAPAWPFPTFPKKPRKEAGAPAAKK
jgi:ParB/RepB/Spo0J family partition protein